MSPGSCGCCSAPATRTASGGSSSSSARTARGGCPAASLTSARTRGLPRCGRPTEEIGAVPPPPRIAGTFHHVEDDGKTQVYLWLCDVPYFHPTLDGATPEETQGAAWFRRKEIAALDLAPKFREDWEKGICLREHVTKALQRTVNENGEVSSSPPPHSASRLSAAAGHTRTGPTARNGRTPALGPFPAASASAGGEPPHRINDMAEPEPHDTLEPRGGDDGKMPSRGRKPNPPASRVPGPGQRA